MSRQLQHLFAGLGIQIMVAENMVEVAVPAVKQTVNLPQFLSAAIIGEIAQ
ncbi:hypothetical protein D3C75_1377270 [compost metagenome]